ncbi:MAG TPA: carbohydrate ABC transporter permease [Armatimonadota bacterium]|nr:carbohydrate ABC transporter permease [Armatimonadota bacterium]
MATTVREEKIRKRSTSRLWANTLTYFLLITGSILVLIPFWWLVRSSLMDPGDIFKPMASWRDVFPLHPLWGNYPEALKFMNFWGCLRNTCTITFFAMAGQIMSASIVAYGFARMRFPGRDILFIVLLSTIMLPPQVTLIPIFKIFTTLGWYDTFKPLTVPAYFGGGVFAIFLLRQYYMTIPIEMDEAAKIDGASTFGIFTRIILPQAKPVLGTVAIFSYMWNWNDFLGPLIYLSDPAKRTLALALWSFQGEHAVDWHLLMAAATVVMLPLLIIFFCAQKYFIQGVVISGVKG